ncbi:MAG: hypothetical protein JXR91_09315 [Deltaproteobacteria bacterium]|nr:hypothetical protein [Deltaproteobacteria bacterium]
MKISIKKILIDRFVLIIGLIFCVLLAGKSATAQTLDNNFYTEYHTYDEIADKIEALKTAYEPLTDLIISIESIGNSYDGREMDALRFTSPEGAATGKPALFLRAGIHAAEQVGVLSSMYVVENLLY